MPFDNRDRPPTAADLDAFLDRLERLLEELALRRRPSRPAPAQPPGQLVTLAQIAEISHRPRRVLERYRRELPPPRVLGRPGRPDRWDWAEVRPWLQTAFGLRLPEHYPGGSP